MLQRMQSFPESDNESFFLWGARQTGKSTLLKSLFPDALWFDLLLADEYGRLVTNPELVRERVLAQPNGTTVVIDEIQRIPELLNEVHWLLVNTNSKFILSGSSSRKITHSGTNLLGGRALRYELYPLVSAEIPDFNLIKAINYGLLPRHYLSQQPKRLLSAYVGNYLQDEISVEAKLRNVAGFSRFLASAAFSNSEQVNLTNIASDCGVSAPTIRQYFEIIEDTLIGRFLPSFQKRPKRRVIRAPKFYFFDVGIANYLLKRENIIEGSENFGHAFEHFIYQELYAHSHYSGLDYSLHYWRTASQLEVDFILGDHQIAIEVKGSAKINQRELSGLRAFSDEYKTERLIMVCLEPMPRIVNGIEVLPWNIFLQKLWGGEILK